MLVSTQKLRNAIFSSLGYDDFNIIRGNKLCDRILFDYGYYDNGMNINIIKGCIFNYNKICKFSDNIEDYQYRINDQELQKIIRTLKNSH